MLLILGHEFSQHTSYYNILDIFTDIKQVRSDLASKATCHWILNTMPHTMAPNTMPHTMAPTVCRTQWPQHYAAHNGPHSMPHMIARTIYSPTMQMHCE